MIVQAIMLLDDLDKEVNTYAMRMKEWYGWHFPELTKILVDNVAYAKTIKFMGMRQNALELDFKEILPEDIEIELKEALKISMGTEISEEDMENIKMLADQVITISEYRTELFEYLKNRMMAIAPNLTALVGELVGARLIANAGSLMNLAKHPASTVQILGAEKALFRALKTKHNTPKYGLIYHATLIGQAAPKLKGKISRVLAAKAALSVRVDALGENTDASIGTEHRAAVEDRLRQLENQARNATSGSFRGKANVGRQNMNAGKSYNSSNDFKFDNSKKRPAESEPVEVKKPKIEVIEPKTEESPKAEEKKKEKKDKKEKKEKKDKKDKKEKKEKKEKKDKS
ncbi:Nop-domain-containing protein [Rozella allomycis CSF55]|uniref:Nucleolar protein 58 n=1 Tax=Rozella allomycis (strain CSF55) TaxID=988480 RepID=A0A075AYY9_ROZAC|nr:NOSIC domain-containing protein [Rozella allomycis CSF55]RKP17325.1 Nop-domain-containing protein [Rozella allomycis CSF55]|eukprot:EPZ35482.1 NOSIC domain-containing protein [Rozella allomycis CSF55]